MHYSVYCVSSSFFTAKIALETVIDMSQHFSYVLKHRIQRGFFFNSMRSVRDICPKFIKIFLPYFPHLKIPCRIMRWQSCSINVCIAEVSPRLNIVDNASAFEYKSIYESVLLNV